MRSWESIQTAEDPSRNARNEREQLFGMVASRAAVPPFIRLVVRESVPIERDPKHAAHAAHASDLLSFWIGARHAGDAPSSPSWHPEPRGRTHERHEGHASNFSVVLATGLGKLLRNGMSANGLPSLGFMCASERSLASPNWTSARNSNAFHLVALVMILSAPAALGAQGIIDSETVLRDTAVSNSRAPA